MSAESKRRNPFEFTCFTVILVALSAISANGADFVVTRTDDPTPDGCVVGDCSLREAIIDANAAAGADTITLPAGTYNLTITGTAGVDDVDPAISDLDIGAGGLTINGAGAASTTINASALSQRAFGMPIDLLFVPSTVNINNLTITGGNTSGLGGNNRGGAIDVGSRHATVTLTGVVLSGNTSGLGAGIHSKGTLNINNTSISNNTGSGVALTVDGVNFKTLTITGSTISGNSGTGVDVDAGTCNITNSTLSGNGASGFTGGVDYGGGLTVGTLTNVTIANNRYGYIGQNDFNGDPAVTFRNSIISGSTVRNIFNTTDAAFARAPTSGGNNLIGDTSGSSFTQPTDKKNVNPHLGSLAVNSPGVTATHALAVNSPALDSASAVFAPATDQRGVARPQGSADDIGAYELIPPDDDSDGYSPPNDCNDHDDQIHPGAPEIPDDGIDQDCSGADTVTCFVDADHDGFGSTATILSSDGDCVDVGESSNDSDCDDGNAAIHPGATEICNGVDDDCDTQIDEGVQSTFYLDADTDGFGDPAVSTQACAAPPGYVTDHTDCDDSNPSVHPGAAEIPNDGIDQDCNGVDSTTCFVDADHDGFGSAATVVAEDGDCVDSGEAANDDDCNDANAAINPNAAEVCDGVDNNCNGIIDEGFPDLDHDGTADCVDPDRDGDGISNNADGCPDDSDKSAPGSAGCGVPEPPAQPIGPDGVSDAVENGAPNNGDGNNDGVPDSQQLNVTSLPNSSGNYVTIVSPAGTELASVAAGANPSPADTPVGVEFPAGFLSYQVTGLSAGAAAQIQIIVQLQPGTQINTYWKFGPEPGQPTPHWYEFLFDGTTGATISGNTITLNFVDGQRGDADLAANGSILDPGAPASGAPETTTTPQTTSSDACSNPLLAALFRFPICGLGCSMAVIGSFAGLAAMMTARRRRR